MTAAQDQRPLIAPGWYRDLSNDDYHGSAGYSSSHIKTLASKTPAHLQYELAQEDKRTDAKELGSAVHTLTLQPEREHLDIAVLPELNLRSPADREQRDEFLKLHKGKAILTADQYDVARAMADSVRRHPDARILLTDIVAESSVYWRHEWDAEDELFSERRHTTLKVRPDGLNPAHQVMLDLKSSNDARPYGFNRTVQKFDYHLSAAMYLDGVNNCDELMRELGCFDPFTNFVFIVVESEPPYLPVVYELDDEYKRIGAIKYQRGLQALEHALTSGWEGYPSHIQTLTPPGWAVREIEEGDIE